MTGQPWGDWVIRRAIWQAILGQKTGQKTVKKRGNIHHIETKPGLLKNSE
jgi:hypothetical protein